MKKSNRLTCGIVVAVIIGWTATMIGSVQAQTDSDNRAAKPDSRSDALKQELVIKGLSRKEKELLIKAVGLYVTFNLKIA